MLWCGRAWRGRQGDNGSYREWGGTREGWGGEANGDLAKGPVTGEGGKGGRAQWAMAHAHGRTEGEGEGARSWLAG